MAKALSPRSIRLKRAYDPPSPEDGRRILVDRLWPRGLRKEAAQIDLWARDIAPSTALRQWFHQNESEWPEFVRRYRAELRAHGEALDDLRRLAREGTVTLVFSSRQLEHNNATVLRDVLLDAQS
jgi:uncharacterized protein YeaO (DUF488 family)